MSMIARLCDYCKSEYQADTRYLKRGQGQFCSQSCSSKSIHQTKLPPAPNTVCGYCQDEIYVKPSRLKKSNSGLVFCSGDHQRKAVKEGIYSTGPKPSGKNPPTRQTCEDCGNLYAGKLNCCRDCRQLRLIGSWLSGDNSVTLGSRGDVKRFVKDYLISNRGDKCEKCGFCDKAPDGRSIIQMDHIDGNCLNNSIENLRLLCPNCHAMTETYGNLNKGRGRTWRRKSNHI